MGVRAVCRKTCSTRGTVPRNGGHRPKDWSFQQVFLAAWYFLTLTVCASSLQFCPTTCPRSWYFTDIANMGSEVFVFYLPVLADGASDSDGNPSEVVTWLRRDTGYSRCARFAVSLPWYCCRGFSWSVSLGSSLSAALLVLEGAAGALLPGGRYLCSVSEDLFSGWLLDGLSSPGKYCLVSEQLLHCLTLSMTRSTRVSMPGCEVVLAYNLPGSYLSFVWVLLVEYIKIVLLRR